MRRKLNKSHLRNDANYTHNTRRMKYTHLLHQPAQVLALKAQLHARHTENATTHTHTIAIWWAEHMCVVCITA